MEGLTRFDVARYSDELMVVVESNLLPPDPSIVVIPLLRNYPAVRVLNPEIVVDGERLILATRLIGGVRRNRLRPVGRVADQGDVITRAIDVLMSGI